MALVTENKDKALLNVTEPLSPSMPHASKHLELSPTTSYFEEKENWKFFQFNFPQGKLKAILTHLKMLGNFGKEGIEMYCSLGKRCPCIILHDLWKEKVLDLADGVQAIVKGQPVWWCNWEALWIK